MSFRWIPTASIIALALTACDKKEEREVVENPAAAAEEEIAQAAAAVDEPTTQAADQAHIPHSATVQVRPTQEYGPVLTDDTGRALYLFELDEAQEGSTCIDACAEAWPPFVAAEPVAVKAEGIENAKVDTITRTDGTFQVRFGGWPLYFYRGDKAPGQMTGQDIEDHGGEWYLVTPTGEKAHGKEEQK